MWPLCPGTCTRAPGQRSDRPFSVTSPTSKTELVADRFRHPFRGATHVPTSAPEGQRSAATFIFEGASGGVERREKGRRPPSPQDGAGLPQERGATGPSLSPPPPQKPKSRRSAAVTCPGEGDMSPPRPQKGSTLPRLSFSRERAGESRGVRRADRPLLPRTVQDCPRREERQPFSVLFSPEVLLAFCPC